MACTTRRVMQEGEVDGGNNWMDAYDPALRDADNTEKYVTSLYWALATVSTVGYGDVLPVNHTGEAVCAL